MTRLLLGAAAAILVTACAGNPKTANGGDTVIDGASAKAAPAPVVTPAPGSCSSDAQCAGGERCDSGRCAPAARCDLVRVRFAFDSVILDEGARKSLRDDAACISLRHPTSLLIEGHCDERGTAQYNIALGARRADAVRKYLADLGVKTRFETVSFGKELPAAEGSTEAAYAQNRRAEMRLPGDKRADGQPFAGP
jgi:peptidoglycan-associated lipoprotein